MNLVKFPSLDISMLFLFCILHTEIEKKSHWYAIYVYLSIENFIQ
jgi:hypothetical protein